MSNLRRLHGVNVVLGFLSLGMGALGVVVSVVAFVVVAAVGIGVADTATDPALDGLAELLCTLPSLFVVAALAVFAGILHLGLAARLRWAQGRILQTVLAVLSVGSGLGTLYAVFALYVCWLDPQATALFRRRSARPVW